MATGDFNGDRRLDLAAARIFSKDYRGALMLLDGRGDGTLRDPVAYPAGNGPIVVVAGDFMGDGGLDLAVTDYGGNLSPGDGTFDLPW